MKFKIEDMKSEKILNSIYTTGLIFFILIILNLLSKLLLIPGISGSDGVAQLFYVIYIIRNITIPILGLITFKLICEILYKIVKACEIIIENHNNKNY